MGSNLLILIVMTLAVALPTQRWIRITLAALFAIPVAIIIVYSTGISHASNTSARNTIHELATYLQKGDTGVVVRTILQSDEILPTNQFHGMTFEKIMWMSQSTNQPNTFQEGIGEELAKPSE